MTSVMALFLLSQTLLLDSPAQGGPIALTSIRSTTKFFFDAVELHNVGSKPIRSITFDLNLSNCRIFLRLNADSSTRIEGLALSTQDLFKQSRNTRLRGSTELRAQPILVEFEDGTSWKPAPSTPR